MVVKVAPIQPNLKQQVWNSIKRGCKSALRHKYFGLRTLAFGDVHKGDDCAYHRTVSFDGTRPVFNRDRDTIFAPEHLIGNIGWLIGSISAIHVAFTVRIWTAIGMGMMDEIVDMFAQQFIFVLVTQHLQEGPVDEGAVAIAVYPISAFSHRIEQAMQILAGNTHRLLRLLALVHGKVESEYHDQENQQAGKRADEDNEVG